jgi:hypothetical protein
VELGQTRPWKGLLGMVKEGSISGGLIMGIFTDGDDEDDELLDLFILNEIHKSSNESGSTNHSGGCLTSFLLLMTVPIGIVLGVVSLVIYTS